MSSFATFRDGWRTIPLDGALLSFHRDTGTNVLCEGEETGRFLQTAPRAIQFGITNHCNLACHFCSRDRMATSEWTTHDVVAMLRDLGRAGVLEVAFGGGEPWAFPRFDELVRLVYRETPLAVSMTTNGTLLTHERLEAIAGCYGQIRLSIYSDNDWRDRILLLAGAGARFGVNYLVTPERLPDVETCVLELVALGCRDVLLLCYKGQDASLHLREDAAKELGRRVATLVRALRTEAAIKLDVCWGERMEAVPHFSSDGRRPSDCGAGRDFVVLTSDKRLQPCSFHDFSVPVSNAAEVLDIWRSRQPELGAATSWPGCARLPAYGLPKRHLPRLNTPGEA